MNKTDAEESINQRFDRQVTIQHMVEEVGVSVGSVETIEQHLRMNKVAAQLVHKLLYPLKESCRCLTVTLGSFPIIPTQHFISEPFSQVDT